MRNVIQSFKKVLNYAPASYAAAVQNDFVLTSGVDSVAAGQTGPTDVQVPTGSVVKYIEIQWSITNLVSVSSFAWMSIQKKHTGQTFVDPRVVGGDPQRNQVFYQKLTSVGQDQNNNYVMRFKVPKKYQRVREGDEWSFTVYTDQISAQACQAIYKFYR